MTENKFNKALGRIAAGAILSDSEEFVAKVEELMTLLDEADQDDYYSTEGWRHVVGWD